MDTRDLMKQVGVRFKQGLEDNIESKGQNTWSDSKAGLKRRRKGIIAFLPHSNLHTGMTLVETGKMVRLIDYKHTNDEINITTKTPHAEWQHYGTRILPARKWFYVNKETDKLIRGDITTFIKKHIEEVINEQ
jgi:phage gpG-like protein